MSAFRYRWVLLGGMRTEADNSESVALPPSPASALRMEVPTWTTRTDWRRPSRVCVLTRREGAGFLGGDNGPSTLAETDRCESRSMCLRGENDLIAVEQKGAALAVREFKWLSAALAEFQQAAGSVLCGYGSGAQQVAGAQVAPSARVMS